MVTMEINPKRRTDDVSCFWEILIKLCSLYQLFHGLCFLAVLASKLFISTTFAILCNRYGKRVNSLLHGKPGLGISRGVCSNSEISFIIC